MIMVAEKESAGTHTEVILSVVVNACKQLPSGRNMYQVI